MFFEILFLKLVLRYLYSVAKEAWNKREKWASRSFNVYQNFESISHSWRTFDRKERFQLSIDQIFKM